MNETCVCSCCGNEQDHSEFYTSHCGMFTYTKHLPVCKTCLSRLFKVYSDGYRDSKKAIKKVFERNPYLGFFSGTEIASKHFFTFR